MIFMINLLKKVFAPLIVSPTPPYKDFDIAWKFIQLLEGFELKGYIPVEEKGKKNKVKSGVTIASGFDLGQHNPEYLNRFLTSKETPLSPETIDKLMPYMSYTGAVAKRKLKANPLTITKVEALEINKAVKRDKAIELEADYNHVVQTNFRDLPQELQTVIMSVAFQYGDLAKRTPNFWASVVANDWELVHKNLSNFGDKYSTRRKKEAKLVRSYLNKTKKG